MRTICIESLAALLILFSCSSSVFAATHKSPPVTYFEIEAYFESSGRILLERMVGAAQDEAAKLKMQDELKEAWATIPALEQGSQAEDALIDELDAGLDRAFTAIANNPHQEMIQRSVQDVYSVFMRHVGTGVLNSEETHRLLMAEIHLMVKPLRQRQAKSCMALLSGNQNFENLH